MAEDKGLPEFFPEASEHDKRIADLTSQLKVEKASSASKIASLEKETEEVAEKMDKQVLRLVEAQKKLDKKIEETRELIYKFSNLTSAPRMGAGAAVGATPKPKFRTDIPIPGVFGSATGTTGRTSRDASNPSTAVPGFQVPPGMDSIIGGRGSSSSNSGGGRRSRPGSTSSGSTGSLGDTGASVGKPDQNITEKPRTSGGETPAPYKAPEPQSGQKLGAGDKQLRSRRDSDASPVEAVDKQSAAPDKSASFSGGSVPQGNIFQAFKNAGYSDKQARALTAEVGRENSYQSKYVFGTHTDAANQKMNVGFFSWQGSRAPALMEHLKKNNALDENGHIKRDQSSLDAMASFSKHEMETNKAYAPTREKFLNNPNIGRDEAAQVLGRNYIAWDMDGRTLGAAGAARHAAGRNKYYEQAGAFDKGELGGKPTADGTMKTMDQSGGKDSIKAPADLRNRDILSTGEKGVNGAGGAGWASTARYEPGGIAHHGKDPDQQIKYGVGLVDGKQLDNDAVKNRPINQQGQVTFEGFKGLEGSQFKAGSGVNQSFPSVPPGTFSLSKQATGPAIANYYSRAGLSTSGAFGSVWNVGKGSGSETSIGRDPLAGRDRGSIQLHAGVPIGQQLQQLRSHGCLAINAKDWPKFQEAMEKAYKETDGKLALQVTPNKDGTASYKIIHADQAVNPMTPEQAIANAKSQARLSPAEDQKPQMDASSAKPIQDGLAPDASVAGLKTSAVKNDQSTSQTTAGKSPDAGSSQMSPSSWLTDRANKSNDKIPPPVATGADAKIQDRAAADPTVDKLDTAAVKSDAATSTTTAAKPVDVQPLAAPADWLTGQSSQAAAAQPAQQQQTPAAANKASDWTGSHTTTTTAEAPKVTEGMKPEPAKDASFGSS